MRYGSAWAAALLCGVLALFPAAVPGSDAPSPAWQRDVVCRDGRVTLHATKAALSEVVGLVAATCGVTQYGVFESPAATDAALDEVPVDAAFERLLGTGNFTLRYRGDRVVGIRVLLASAGGPSAGLAPGTEPRVPGMPAPEGKDGTSLSPAAASGWGREIPVDRKLASLLGHDKVPARTLLQTALTHERSIVRRRAMRTLLRTAEHEPEFLALFRDYGGMDPSAIASMARQGMGDGADRSLRLVYSSLTDPRLRQQVQQVLGALRTSSSPTPTPTE
jgi:hypothetical protein